MSDREDPLSRVQALGYTVREAGFLQLVIEHSGYFLSRQFDRFMHQAPGRARAALTQKLLDRGHAVESRHARQIRLYHVCARPLYRAIGQEDNRNRRTRPPHLIRTRVMSLDFVLEHPDYRFLPHGQERARYFSESSGVAVERLPAKRYLSRNGRPPSLQYFVDKFPAFLAPGSDDTCFCYMADGAEAGGGFDTYLHQYEGLFTGLEHVRVVYAVARDHPNASAAETAFRRWRARLPLVGGQEPAPEDLLAHFQRRQLYETGQFGGLTKADLTELRAGFQAFRGDAYERLFEQWKRHGVETCAAHDGAETASSTRRPRFDVSVLPHRYDFFHTVREYGSSRGVLRKGAAIGSFRPVFRSPFRSDEEERP